MSDSERTVDIQVVPLYAAYVDSALIERAVECTLQMEQVVGPVEVGILITDDAGLRRLIATRRFAVSLSQRCACCSL